MACACSVIVLIIYLNIIWKLYTVDYIIGNNEFQVHELHNACSYILRISIIALVAMSFGKCW